MICNFGGFLLWLFSAVLCLTLSWPRRVVVTNLHGTPRWAPSTGTWAMTLGETQSNPPSLVSSCPAGCIKALASLLDLRN